MAWTDDNGYNDLYGDRGSGGEDPAGTACNPSSQPEVNPPSVSPEYICKGTPPNYAAYQCESKNQTVQPPAPADGMYIDECGDLSWELYSETDIGQAGNTYGSCDVIGCTTGDDFVSSDSGEDSGVTGYCCWTDCGAEPPRRTPAAAAQTLVALRTPSAAAQASVGWLSIELAVSQVFEGGLK